MLITLAPTICIIAAGQPTISYLEIEYVRAVFGKYDDDSER